MNRDQVAEVLAKPISQALLESSIPARLAYVGVDGAPGDPDRFPLDRQTRDRLHRAEVGESAALRKNPSVALTIDTQDQWPPRALLIRGVAQVGLVDGVPDGYVEASRKVIPAEDFEGWE
jgi:hypothetical protein